MPESYSKYDRVLSAHALCEITTVLSWQVCDYGFDRTSVL